MQVQSLSLGKSCCSILDLSLDTFLKVSDLLLGIVSGSGIEDSGFYLKTSAETSLHHLCRIV